MAIQSQYVLSKDSNGDVRLVQNSVDVFKSTNASAIANTLVLKEGMVGVGLVAPTTKLHVRVANTINKQALLVEQLDTTNNPVCAYINNYGTNTALYIRQDGALAASKYGLYLYSNAVQNASPLAYFLQDNVSSDQDLLVLKQDGTGNALNITAGKLKLPSGGAINEFSTDGTLAGNSDDAVPTEKAIRTYVTSGAVVKAYSDGTYIDASADTERTTNSGTYVKLKEITPLVRSGIITVAWQMRLASGDQTAYSKVYINGSPVGVEKTITGSISYTDFSETNLAVNIGDVIQIYGHISASTEVYIKCLKIKCSNPTISQEVPGY
jgi:hypothetical protein